MQPPNAPRDDGQAITLEQRKAMLIDAIRQTQSASEEDARSIIDGLDETGRWYIKSFATLSKTRATEPHPEPIAMDEITSYIETQEVQVAPDVFVEMIQTMDRAWMDAKRA